MNIVSSFGGILLILRPPWIVSEAHLRQAYNNCIQQFWFTRAVGEGWNHHKTLA